MNRVNVPRKGHGGAWTYLSAQDSLREAGLKMLEEYIRLRQNTIAMWIADRPIYKACMD